MAQLDASAHSTPLVGGTDSQKVIVHQEEPEKTWGGWLGSFIKKAPKEDTQSSRSPSKPADVIILLLFVAIMFCSV